ncbi:DEKNAAC100540 [Brettanomyces naardenensis]|uniref:DEKNAAC100540 n=1 Tax=Brettanomyces naardenensis TaxID=13370 RepID=A0A448YG71_BRENA|nr:DEKNAAC100540 [Brettanomyces naardenensis]
MSAALMAQMSGLLAEMTNGAASGTGIVPLLGLTKTYLGLSDVHQLPDYLIVGVKELQQAQFGSYPDTSDVAPSAVFVATFFILCCGHLGMFIANRSRGHKFYMSLAFAFYCLMRWIGFAMRIAWAKDILKLQVGLASEVFLIIPTVLLASFNLVLAQRLFTWKHPIGGTKKWFWWIMLALYSVVLGVVLMAIIAGVVPYLYFLSQKHYDMCRNVMKVASVCIVLYSLLALILVAAAFAVPTAAVDREALIYQPFWIKSFSPFYFPPKDASKTGEALFVRRHAGDSRVPIRTVVGAGMKLIDKKEEPESEELNQYEQSGADKFTLKHNKSILIVATTTIFVFLGAIFRCVGVFMDKTYATQGWIFKPVVMYVLWGALETIVNIIYLVGRIDLRFYRPDSIKGNGLSSASSAGSETEKDAGEPLEVTV